jgi:hypothetical protein
VARGVERAGSLRRPGHRPGHVHLLRTAGNVFNDGAGGPSRTIYRLNGFYLPAGAYRVAA